jgi:hypothetical protein
MARLVAAIGMLVLAACSDADDPPLDLTQLGAACGAGDSCQDGVTCLTYTGFAGNELKSCEIACPDDPAACPAGTTCVVIADGPGAVCRLD